jgi:hypothetical protein
VLRIGDELTAGMDLYFGSELESETLKQRYGMPPVAPGGFDVRFADHSRLLEAERGVIRLRSDDFPVRIELVASPEGHFEDYTIEALAGEEVVGTYRLSEGQGLMIDNVNVTGIRFGEGDVLEIDALPDAFTLTGNYPNPFNPTTNIVFDLPENATMRVGIYDLLGRRVLEIDSIEMTAGAGRQVQIDAASLASGTYVYRIQAEMASGVAVKSGRMTLLK